MRFHEESTGGYSRIDAWRPPYLSDIVWCRKFVRSSGVMVKSNIFIYDMSGCVEVEEITVQVPELPSSWQGQLYPLNTRHTECCLLM